MREGKTISCICQGNQTPQHRCDGFLCDIGREDMDVKMLGDGRPFVMEISNARAQMPSRECFTRAENELNASGVGVEVKKLQPVDKAALKHIKVRLPSTKIAAGWLVL